MIDPRKVWIAAAAAVLIIAITVVAIVVGVQSISRHPLDAAATAGPAAEEDGPSSAPSPDPITTPAEATPPPGAYDQELSVTPAIYARASAAAVAASTWDSSEPMDARAARLADAGLSADLQRSFKPVWASIFAAATTASITTTAAGEPGLNSITGDPGKRQYRIGVTLSYQGSWNANGAARSQQPASATWWVTVDEATGTAVAIEQPTPNDLQIRLTS
ncbi:hypothetical protein [Clavibacter michiganensis]|uniref:hypothetical protein n=2 Tax=Clavibacter michiganensis TaxID=28447 RepID=UPI00292E32B4|nr:hypothetical protein [Clavibacter michiganensis]